jgi:hypothetical protein
VDTTSYQLSEIVNLVLLLGLSPIIIGAARRFRSPVATAVYVALGFMLGAYVTTILEGFLLYDLFNTLEHLCYMFAGITFVALVVMASRARDTSESAAS